MANKFGIILIILILLAGMVYFLSQRQDDGSTVAESIFNPNENEVEAPTGSFVSRIDQLGTVLDLTIVPLQVIEDSRCPIDVTCIQAGTVRVRTLVSSNDFGEAERVFVLSQPIFINSREVVLTSVEPAPVSTISITPQDYTFSFTVTDRSAND